MSQYVEYHTYPPKLPDVLPGESSLIFTIIIDDGDNDDCGDGDNSWIEFILFVSSIFCTEEHLQTTA